MRRAPLLVFSVLALAFFGVGYVLLPEGAADRPLLALVGVAPVAVLLLFAAAPALAPLGPAARVGAALWPLVAATLLLSGLGPTRTAHIATLGLWPFVIAFLAAGLSLIPAEAGRQQAPTLALFPLGAALVACIGTGLTLALPGLARLCLATPYHFVIFLTLAVVIVALSDTAATRLTAPRERLIRALIGLMPLLGFLGTIAGIIDALASLPDLFGPAAAESNALPAVMRGLSTAFETTLIGLVGAASTSFLLILLVDRDREAA